MKIAVLVPKSEFGAAQQQRLTGLGDIVYVESRNEHPVEKLKQICSGADIIAVDPDPIGGFEVAFERLNQIMDSIPNLKGIALATTSFGYIDLEYCKKRDIAVTNVPFYSTESVAEHTLAFLLGCAKRIFITDRQTQKGNYRLIEGFELKGKTLGIIGLGHIGTRVADLGISIGMNVIAWNRTAKSVPGVKMQSLDEVLAKSDAISLHLAHSKQTEGFLSKKRIEKLKKGVIIVNTADRGIVDEIAMAEALISGKVDSYVMEGEDLESSPLGNVENAFLFKGFGWFTKESIERGIQIWVDNIEGIIKGNPVNPVYI